VTRPALGPTKYPQQNVTRALFQGVKRSDVFLKLSETETIRPLSIRNFLHGWLLVTLKMASFPLRHGLDNYFLYHIDQLIKAAAELAF
jgi:hypothetical protein